MKSTPGMKESFWQYHQAYEHRLEAWKVEVLYTWEWWFGIVLSIIAWSLWLFFRKKESSNRLLFAGIFTALISVTLDNIGYQLSLWNYYKPVTPLIPAYLPYDFALMPVVVMFLIQFFYGRNPWLIGLLFGLLTAFIGEPVFKLLGIYHPVHWNNIYSIPFYTIIYNISFKLAMRSNFEKLK